MPEKKQDQIRRLPSLKELVDLINFSEMERDPVVRKLVPIVTLDYDPSLIEDILERIQPALNRKILQPDPFSPNPKDNDVDGEIKIGKVKKTGALFGLALDELNQHTLITGRAGSGKTTIFYLIATQLLEQGIPFWTFDFKQDYRHLLSYSNSNIHVFNWRNFKFNPLRPPNGCNPVIWMQAFTNVFAQAYWLMAGSKGLIQNHLNKLYADYGVYEGKDIYPSLQDLQDSINRHVLERKFGREAGFMESIKNRLDECILPLSGTFDCDKGFPIEDLLEKTVIFELDSLLFENQLFLTTILLRFFFEYRISNRQRGFLKHIIFFDEAKMVYDNKRDYIQGLGQNEVTQFTSQIREFGEGLVVADQMPIVLSDSIKSNVYTTICMSQSGGKNMQDMASALHLNQDQVIRMNQLVSDKDNQIFEAIVNINGRWPTPFLIEVIPFRVDKSITEEQVDEKMNPLLQILNEKLTPRISYNQILEIKKMGTESRSNKPQDKIEESPKDNANQRVKTEGNILIRILNNIKDHPFISQKERINMLNLGSSTSTNNKFFKELVDEGYVTTVKIGLGKGRSSKVLYEITDKGKDFARMRDFVIPGKGELEHKFWQHTIKHFYETLGYRAEIEKRYGMKNVDVGLNKDGEKIAIEIELTPKNLISNVQRDFEEDCNRIIIAAKSQRALTSYRKRIQYINEELLKKVEFRVLSDFLSERED